MSDVFISYKRENLAAVNRLVQALRAEGVSVWWDQDIQPNAPWEATIERELAAAKLVIVAWSPASVASDNVKAEARWARGQGRLLQVFVEPCEPPLFFGERQGVDLNGWSGAASDPAFRTMLQAIRAGPTPLPENTARAASSTAEPPALALPNKPSVAVLPFGDMSGAKDQDYFADGMVQEIITALSRFPSLFVIGSGSSLNYRDSGRNLKQIAHDLGVRYLLEGSVRRSGERVRISASLTDAVEGLPIWTERFDGTLEDVFALQDTVANAVASQIEPSITSAELRRANARPTQDLGAYDFYLKAYQRIRVFDEPSYKEALALLDQAIARDPDYALALATAALTHATVILMGWSDDPAQSQTVAKQQLRRALLVGGDDPDVLAQAAYATTLLGEPGPGEAMIERALALNPGASLSWYYGGWIKLTARQPELAIEHFRTGLRLDPRSPDRPFIIHGIGAALCFLGRFDEAVPLMQEALQLRPHNAAALAVLTVAYAHLGRIAEAEATLGTLKSISSLGIFTTGAFAMGDENGVFRSGLALLGANV
jgi:adenylate cyclase